MRAVREVEIPAGIERDSRQLRDAEPQGVDDCDGIGLPQVRDAN